eukprot:SAG31_NODE_7527_length_1665_cov_1.745849_2_plen_78_part_00
MNTLISHTSDPLAALQQAAKVAAPGALLVVMDGDYHSLTYANLDDPALGRCAEKLAPQVRLYCFPVSSAMISQAGND